MDEPGEAPQTSVAISQRVDAVERGVAALDGDTRAHVAEVITRWWTRTAIVGAVCIAAPVGGCTVMTAVLPQIAPVIVAAAWILMFGSFPVQLILRGIAKRAVRDDVKLLGYDDAAQDVALQAWKQVEARTTLPVLGRKRRERKVLRVLDELVGKASQP